MELSAEGSVGLMGEYKSGELCAFHPSAFSRDRSELGNFATVDGDCDDLAGVNAVEQRSSVVS